MKILVINGPNINMLGVREPEIYGAMTYPQLIEYIVKHAEAYGVEAEVYQSNAEGEIIDIIHSAHGKYDAIVINPAAFTHTSYAIFDAIKTVSIPTVEVHISNVHQREAFRHKSVTVAACVGQICGLGVRGYTLAIEYLAETVGKS